MSSPSKSAQSESTQAQSSRPPRKRSLVVAGSTGSIGRQALDVVQATPERFEVTAIGGGSSVTALAEQANLYHPRVVALADGSRSKELQALVPRGTEVRTGPDALTSIAREGEVVLNGVVGFAGLGVTVAALEAGARLALANKESLIAGAPVVQKARQSEGAELVPVDSEHCAIHQCLGVSAASGGVEGAHGDVSRLWVTASGGPFRGRRLPELRSVSVEEALAHPTWKMGPKITIDSSTLMNKGLEVLEAHELFGIDFDRISVVVHPQSVVHSMVEYRDGAVLAQLSMPDMRLPIGYALGYPERLDVPYGAIDWSSMRTLEFELPDTDTFSCLRLAYEAGREGGSAPCWLNAANEVAVAAFLDRRISWADIAAVVATVLERHEPTTLLQVEDVLQADRQAREVAAGVVDQLAMVA